ncbi:MAG: aminomethyltransferase [Rickettsiales bacterium]|nr:MAG: aminomethyltransferase [Rickettsiales bacterium]
MIEILTNRAVLHVRGGDAGKFLQALVSNDVVGKIYSYNYFLTNQGRYLFDFFVYKETDSSYFIDLHEKDLVGLIKKLTLYKLRSDVEIQDRSGEYKILYSNDKLKTSAETDAETGVELESNAKLETGAKFSLQDPRFDEMGFRSLIQIENINYPPEKYGAIYNSDKYHCAIADGRPDLIYDRSIPIEYGAEELLGIDYRKGCYIGQEVISRAKYQGVVRKKIFKLSFDKELSGDFCGTDVTDLEGKKLGIVCSGYKNQVIALLREENYLGLAEKLSIVNGETAEILIPPWRTKAI